MPLSEPASWVLPHGMQDDTPPQASLLPASPCFAFDNHGPSRSGSKATSHKATPDPPRENQPHSPVILKQAGPTCVFLVLFLWQWLLSSLLLSTGTLPCSLSHMSDKPKALQTMATVHFTVNVFIFSLVKLMKVVRSTLEECYLFGKKGLFMKMMY